MVYGEHLALTAVLFRYVSEKETIWIRENGQIRSNRGETFLTPGFYAMAADAYDILSLPFRPTHRIGPIESHVVTFDGVTLRRAKMKFGWTGGGWETSTNQGIPYGVTTELT